MDPRRRGALLGGVLLVLLGVWLLVAQFVPGLSGWFQWPMIFFAVALFLLFMGVVTNEPDMAVPACVVAGLGGIFYWQSTNEIWDSWSYIWALIPGFVGVGVVMSNIIKGQWGKALDEGGSLILISAVLFVVFGSVFGALALGPLGQYWPVLLILVGVVALLRAVFARRR